MMFLVVLMAVNFEVGSATDAKKTYHFQTASANWNTASATCQEYGARLATVATFEENEQLRMFKDDFSFSVQTYWISLHQPEAGSRWVWSDCTDIVSHNFSRWDISEPAETGRYCVIVDKTDERWKANSCTLSHPFICETRGPFTFELGSPLSNESTGLVALKTSELECKTSCRNYTGPTDCDFLLYDQNANDCLLYNSEPTPEGQFDNNNNFSWPQPFTSEADSYEQYLKVRYEGM